MGAINEQQVSKIDAIKNLIFGEEIHNIDVRLELYEERIEGLEHKIDSFSSLIDARMASIQKEIASSNNDLSINLQKQVEKDIKNVQKEVVKEIQQVKKSSSDEKSKLADILIKMGQSLKK